MEYTREDKYTIWLFSIPGMRQGLYTKLIEEFGSAAEVYACRGDARLQKCFGAAYAVYEECRNESFARRAVEKYDNNGIMLLRKGGQGYPALLSDVPDAPSVLFAKGRAVDMSRCVAVVGTRSPSDYGVRAAELFSDGLAKAGYTVVSGLALGIDAAAHGAALAAGGATAAVLGCGLDIVYPAENKELYERIEENGLLISEFPLGAPPSGRHFPQRNRIISGMCSGVLVVECGLRSGALSTARHAAAQGRKLFAVPGNIFGGGADGVNMLISSGARAVSTPRELIAAIEGDGSFTYDIPPAPKTERKKKSASGKKENADSTGPSRPAVKVPAADRDLSPDEKRILEALAGGELSADELIAVTGIPAYSLISLLTGMEIDGIIGCWKNRYFEAADRPR